jgi:hypothetical protein
MHQAELMKRARESWTVLPCRRNSCDVRSPCTRTYPSGPGRAPRRAVGRDCAAMHAAALAARSWAWQAALADGRNALSMYNGQRSLTGSLTMQRTKYPLWLVLIAKEHPPTPTDPSRHCRYCLAPLTNGAICCCDECGDKWFKVVPIGGERTIASYERLGYAKLVERLRKLNGRSASA